MPVYNYSESIYFCIISMFLTFQYAASCRKAFEVVHIALASYSHNYLTNTLPYLKLAGSLLTSGRYVMNPELRAEKVSYHQFLEKSSMVLAHFEYT